MEEASKPFVLGLALFICFFFVARTIETVRRYYISSGSYDDILLSNFAITGLNLVLRLLYYIIAWSGITAFYFVFEKYTLKQGLKKNTRYILTIFSAAEAFFTSALYFTAAASWIMICVIILFLVVAFFPVILFAYIAQISPTRDRRIAWDVITIGFLLFMLAIMLDLPETYIVVTEYMGLPYFPPAMVHYGTPIMMMGGGIMMGIGFASIYRDVL